ncbi:MAG: hypothetical protein DHS20C15_18950 [Planctomycetota bacterium]|nr:MAG: hypothetical protein DHS20C15_18950 [Planctomycetota bacterium]
MLRAGPRLLLLCTLLISCGGSDLPIHPYIVAGTPEQVVLITVGGLRADHMRSYSYGPKREVPEAIRRDISSYRISEIFDPGVVFDNVQASSSQSAPSLATIFTGLIPSKHGVLENGQRLAESVPSMASVFKDAGYQTAAILGAAHLESVATGFDEVVAERAHATQVRLEATRWLRKRRTSQRFFLWVHFSDVRDWYMSYKPGRWANYTEKEEQVRDAAKGTRVTNYRYFSHLHGLPELHDPAEFEPVDFGARPNRNGLMSEFKASDYETVLNWFDRYDGRLAHVDLEVRELVKVVEELGLSGRKLYMFTSDHGEALGDHGYVGHDRDLYEAQLRVPLLMRFSGGDRPVGRVRHQVRHTDLFFTMAQMLGRDLNSFHPAPDGESLLPLLPGAAGADRAEARVAYAERQPVDDLRRELGWTDERVWSVRTPEFRLIVREEGEDELYKMVGRPREAMNLAGQDHPAEAALRKLLAERLEWVESHPDEIPAAGEPEQRWLSELVMLGERR